jgi:hypothetical protein
LESEIRSPGLDSGSRSASTRQLVPMHVGTAMVYVEQLDEPPVVYDPTGGIRPVAPPDLADAFRRASDAIQECVTTVGSRVESLASRAKPEEITVEFSITFEAQGGIHLLPVLVTAQSKIGTGLKVTARWSLAEGSEGV